MGQIDPPPSNSRTDAYFFMRFFAFSSLSKVLLGDIRFSSVAPPVDPKLINFQLFFAFFRLVVRFLPVVTEIAYMKTVRQFSIIGCQSGVTVRTHFYYFHEFPFPIWRPKTGSS